MHTLRTRLETGFSQWGGWVYDNKFKTLAFMLLIVAGFITQLPNLTLDTSNEGFLHKSDPILEQYDNFRDQFGRDEIIMLSVKAPDVFDKTFLQKLSAFHADLEENLPFMDEVSSLVNARNTRGESDTLIVEELFKEIPDSPDALNKKKNIALNSSLYENFLLSEDASLTTIMITTSAYSNENIAPEDIISGFDEAQATGTSQQAQSYLSDEQNSEIVNAIKEIVAKYQADDFQILAAGSPIVVDAIKRAMQNDMQTFVNLALGIIAVVLFILFRRISGVLLPIVIVILTLISTLSVMAISGTAMKLPTQILPLFLLAVGVAAAVHLLAIFFRHFNEYANKREAIAYAMGHSGLAVMMTSLTTSAGLLSFSSSEVSPIADLGLFSASGVLISLLYTLILLPSVIALLPLKQKADASTHKRTIIMDKILNGVASIAITHSRKIIIIAAVIFIVAIIGVSQVSFKHNPLKWLPESWEARQATELLDVEMKGTSMLEVVINTNKVNGLYEPRIMNTLDKLTTSIGQITQDDLFVGKIISVVDILKESNRALNQNNEDFYSVPQNKELIAQELLLFENSGSDDLEDFVDSQFSMARFTIKTPWVDAAANARFIHEVEKQFEAALADSESFYVTGMGSLFSRVMDASIESTKQSYMIAAVVITFMMILMLGSVKLGLISMIPNLLPIVIAIGFMGYFSMPLDQFTMLIGSICIGLVVDDTIHFMHNFRRYNLNYNDVDRAIRETILSTGRAIVVTTLVLSLGFFIFTAASMDNLIRFGLITGMTIILALLGDLLLAPALMKEIYQKKQTISNGNITNTKEV